MVSVAVTASLAGVPASAQMDTREGIALQNQILELRRELQGMRDLPGRAQPGAGGSFLGSNGRPVPLTPGPYGGGGGGGGNSDLTAQLLDRVNALEEQVRALRGRVEEIGNQAQVQGQDMTKQIGDLTFRLQRLEGSRGGAPASPKPPQENAPPSRNAEAAGSGGSTAARKPEAELQEGRAALARHDYDGAEAAARDILANNRTSPRAYDAQFLLAQALAGRQNWSQAAIAYDDTYSRSRNGAHAQDALLGLGTSLIGLGDKRAGCAALAKLRTDFSHVRSDLSQQVAAARQRGGC